MSTRTLAEWLSYLEQLHPNAIDMGLDRCEEVARRLGLSRPAKQVVTVSGTNGKGSTCAFVAALVRSQGLKVGVYSSPHLLRYNERVQIDGAEADDAALCAAFEAVDAARGEITLTYFEMGTLAAFWLFGRAALDVAVLEVGLGGRLDAVNIVDADIALISSIGLDHAEWLGDTRESVAAEKAGIFRPGQRAVCGDLDPPAVLIDIAQEKGTELLRRGADYEVTIGSDSWQWRGVTGTGEPLSLHALPMFDLPMENAGLALQAYALLGYPWVPEQISAALANTRMHGRLERHLLERDGQRFSLLLDVGHNPHAAAYLAERLNARALTGGRLAVFGLLADKDLEGVLAPLLPVVHEWGVAPLPTARTRPAETLKAALDASSATATVYPDVRTALDAQYQKARTGDEIIVLGSFYCVAEALEWLAER
ncbi:bifunctional tetrahydrofolate synthase/dihydrofolate synthase [Pseudomonas matsuisoli]|uniref:Dihydrofolate synthase/folylpolyglutamate synthase n=1 Tax=Pseudomonas matsuisoli TaxID=1515666 RepID=A0A917URD5_9PSED|nr:bifunctional tetrahydrofolate synthase/dihydrofolate synthase [Pseudomonas matsuisoli]GGJ79993.1 bifunctional folylpolyglutamate synthase/dihydrofolate synthase [Pseudomonas matsuisoli]